MPGMWRASKSGGASCLLLLAFGLWATSANGNRQGQPTVMRTTSRVVRINAVVTDESGQPVKGLQREDFKVLDDGRPQRIAVFSTVDDSIPLLNSSSYGPDTYTNDRVATGDPPSVTILLFDTVNAHWSSQGYGLNRIRHFLRQIRPGNHIGIYVLGDDLRVVHDFKNSAADLIAAISRYDQKGSGGAERKARREEESAEDQALDGFLGGKDNRYRFELSGGGAAPGYRADKLAFASQMTVASLGAIARQLSSVSGRKTLIWVTDSVGPMSYFMYDDVDPILKDWRAGADGNLAIPRWQNGTDVEQMIELMNNAGIAVYTVDERGLETESLGFDGEGSPDPISFANSLPQPNGDLIALAQRTGGRAFYNRNDLETGIRRALDDARFAYSIAYAPDHNDWKGEWRKIQVKVDRPDVAVLARSGYFALPAPRPMSPKNRYDFLSEIAASPLNSAQLPFSIHISAQHGHGPDQILAGVDIPPQSLATILAPAPNGQIVGHFEIEFMQIDPKHKLLNATQKQIDADLTPDEYSKMTRGGWRVTVRLPVKYRAQTLCVILHDEASDEVGSIHIPMAPYAEARGPAAARN